MKKCLFYLPYHLEEHGTGARMIRPRKMIHAFREIGYEVFVIEGTSSDRKRLIKEAKHRIVSGEQFDFMYTESHTEPTLLTDPKHLPMHPFLDFGFYRFVRKHGVRIGLFYCDLYWKFDLYGTGLPAWKKQGALFSYKYDIKEYKKYLERFYVADLKVCSYLQEDRLTTIAEELPPGADDLDVKPKNYNYKSFEKKPLTVFYVGGLGGNYQIAELVKAINHTENTKLIICCRKTEWEKEKTKLGEYINERITIIHKNSNELEPYYQKADLCSLMFKNGIYVNLAKPYKAFEYLAHEIPVLSTRGTAIGTFVEKNGIGWNIEFNASIIEQLLHEIMREPKLLEDRIRNCKKTKQSNLWTSRAQKVATELSL